jgi:hypothetical protein
VQGFERLREATVSIEEIQDPYEGLQECGPRYRSLAQANPMLYQIMFQKAPEGFEPSDEAYEVASRHSVAGQRSPARHGCWLDCRGATRRHRTNTLGQRPWVGIDRAPRHWLRSGQRRRLRSCLHRAPARPPPLTGPQSLAPDVPTAQGFRLGIYAT